MALTARQVATEKRPGTYPDGGNLYLKVAKAGARSWIFRYMLAGRRRDMGLGPIAFVSLAQARVKAFELRRDIWRDKQVADLPLDQVDPIEKRKTAKATITIKASTPSFAAIADRYIAAHESSWSSRKHQRQWRQSLDAHINPAIGTLPIPDVDRAAVLRVLAPMWTTIPETASRCRGRIEAIIDYAIASGLREGPNPAAWKGGLQALLPKRSSIAHAKPVHFNALPYADLPEFMTELRALPGAHARAFELMVLTCTRTNEVLGAKWAEIDFQARLWTVPASRMKGRREHRVPLSTAALAVLDRIKEAGRASDYLFPGRNSNAPASDMALLLVLRKLGRKVTAHGFRSTFSDWVTESTNFPTEAREMALAHRVGSQVEQAYRRTDMVERRRQLMEAWAQHCGTQLSNNVHPLRATSG